MTTIEYLITPTYDYAELIVPTLLIIMEYKGMKRVK